MLIGMLHNRMISFNANFFLSSGKIIQRKTRYKNIIEFIIIEKST